MRSCFVKISIHFFLSVVLVLNLQNLTLKFSSNLSDCKRENIHKFVLNSY
ncbi:hypothetical protein CAMSH0001_1595 [Campylobacter showae RM3277]|uniref:Uncharacterized protein n=1 Tax=Campylobacter showae RM3277 TaxID=553219 RepID=C6RCP4_9BACT|nr:hypothetical protein CAMSH0001_1595 [Campylobacter showae RM3277]